MTRAMFNAPIQPDHSDKNGGATGGKGRRKAVFAWWSTVRRNGVDVWGRKWANGRHNRESVMGEWKGIETAPISTPLEQKWFLAFCPNDAWGAMGNIHLAVRYRDEPMVKPYGTNGDRSATHWMPTPEPPK